MVYNTNVLMTVSECDEFITDNSSKKNTLLFKKSRIESAIVTNSSIVSLIPSELAIIANQIQLAQEELTNATEVSEQRALSIEINSLENQQMRLLSRSESKTGTVLLEKQLALAKIDKEVEALEEYAAALLARRSELTASAAA